MSDWETRKLERAASSGDRQAAARLLWHRLRSVPFERVSLGEIERDVGLGHGVTWIEDADYAEAVRAVLDFAGVAFAVATSEPRSANSEATRDGIVRVGATALALCGSGSVDAFDQLFVTENAGQGRSRSVDPSFSSVNVLLRFTYAAALARSVYRRAAASDELGSLARFLKRPGFCAAVLAGQVTREEGQYVATRWREHLAALGCSESGALPIATINARLRELRRVYLIARGVGVVDWDVDVRTLPTNRLARARRRRTTA